VDDLCRELFLRVAVTAHDRGIKNPAFFTNIDQTNVVFQSSTSSTFEEKGSKQVAVVGKEEKRAFTTLIGITGIGDLLGFQSIYSGKTSRSLPQRSSLLYEEALSLGIMFEFSKTDTYWSTLELMCKYVTEILVPYWTKQKELVGAPPDQECILLLDVWTVHWSIAFRTWLDRTFPWIHYIFVPAGCTGVAQPCDVGIQCSFKHVIKQCQHTDVVDETLALLQAGTAPVDLRLNTTIGTVRDRSVAWLVKAHKAINRPFIAKKASHFLTESRAMR
jgi:hypothetical protein